MVKITTMIRASSARTPQFPGMQNDLLADGWEFDGSVQINNATGEMFRFFVKDVKETPKATPSKRKGEAKEDTPKKTQKLGDGPEADDTEVQE